MYKIGYSCRGFLWNWIIDTPDGGRSHRPHFLKSLVGAWFHIIMLQKNRDLYEANENINLKWITFNNGFPEIDILFLEYRWPITGRNTNLGATSSSYTPDYDRQMELINFYSAKNIPIFLWDKDQKLTESDPVKTLVHYILEPSINPNDRNIPFLFPFDTKTFSRQSIYNYEKASRSKNMIYIGNQYERDEEFKKYFSDIVFYEIEKSDVYWNRTKYPERLQENIIKFPGVNFFDRVWFSEVSKIYQRYFSTVLIAPERYYKTGQFTQRLFESIGNGCIPLCPSYYSSSRNVVIPKFVVDGTKNVAAKLMEISRLDNEEIKDYLTNQYDICSWIFDVNKNIATIIELYKQYYG